MGQSNDNGRWGNSRHKTHRSKRSTTVELMNVADQLPVKPFVGQPPRTSPPPPAPAPMKGMQMKQSDLHRAARQMIDYLATKEAKVKMGETWCNSNRIMLTMRLNSITQPEADGWIEKTLQDLKTALER